MRIRNLAIKNLRAIESFHVTDAESFVVIAGPNGCGKTTVLDAVRILKSIYTRDEWRRWFGEFGINLDRPTHWHTLFRDPSRPVEIESTFVLDAGEATFLRSHAKNIALSLVINDDTEQPVPVTGDPPIVPPTTAGDKEAEWRRIADEVTRRIIAALDAGNEFAAGVTLAPDHALDPIRSILATAAFSCFSPSFLGEIEFHTSRRSYSRENVTSIRLNLGDRSEERRNRFLYDLESKYKNIKTQLGEEYVAAVLQRTDPAEAPLQLSIKELFRIFFPGKEFLGVTMVDGGELRFPIRLATGETHDIDELSSGEKEIVYGYLWLRTGTPKGSVILIDEPELHLNPALLQGLAAFYKVHLADALGAQVWIVTHSDGILRQAVRTSGMAVYHMGRATGDGTDQAVRIDSQDAVEAAVLDLVGDLAAYRPHAKIVLLEGDKDTKFDVEMVRRLFPELTERANFVAAGSRAATTHLRGRLMEVLRDTGLTGRAVCITDSDRGIDEPDAEVGEYRWPVYEIENFLLNDAILRAALTALLGADPYADDAQLEAHLRELATSLVVEIAMMETQAQLNRECVSTIRIGGSVANPVDGLHQSLLGSKSRIDEIDATRGRIQAIFETAAADVRRQIEGTGLRTRVPGDRLLRALAGAHGVNGDHFRNACLDQAQRLRVRPDGMEQTLTRALE